MDRRTRVELVIRKSHAGRIEIAASPARQAFDNGQFAGIDERHVRFYAEADRFRGPRNLVINCEVSTPGSKYQPIWLSSNFLLELNDKKGN